MKKALLWGLSCVLALIPCASFAAVKPAQLVNLSARMYVGTGESTAIAGFVVDIDPSASPLDGSLVTKTLLIRGVGQSLTAFGVTDPASGITISIYDSKGALVASNAGWNNSVLVIDAQNQTGAFPLALGSTDAALVLSLHPGAYTVQATAPTSLGKTVLIEIYDISRDLGRLRLMNLSVRTGYLPVILGAVGDGGGPVKLLFRVVGPGLAQFGLTSVAQNPMLVLYNNNGAVLATNSGWSPSLAPVFTQVGAFPLSFGSHDAALLWTLEVSGPVTIMAYGQDGTGTSQVVGHTALVETYVVP